MMKRAMSLMMGMLVGVVALMESGCQSAAKTESMALTCSAERTDDHAEGLTSHRTSKGGREYDRS
ncbi:MAG: hypothetical protein IT449_15710 [Phycisphaerales bacterium]|nr:hypothetical protein [Phycisphaerales bacterium]